MGSPRKQPTNKPPEPPPPTVKVEDTRSVTVTFNFEGIETALIEAARQQAEAKCGQPIPDDPIFQGIELDLSADMDGDNVALNGATVTFKFAKP